MKAGVAIGPGQLENCCQIKDVYILLFAVTERDEYNELSIYDGDNFYKCIIGKNNNIMVNIVCTVSNLHRDNRGTHRKS